MTSDDVHQQLQTMPAMVRQNRFHWQLADGSLWTDFVVTARGARIIGWIIESESARSQGGEAYELDRIFSQFYQAPDASKLPRIIELASVVGMLEPDHSRRSFSTFLAIVFRGHPDEMPTWIASDSVKQLTETQRQVVYSAIQQAKVERSPEILGQLMKSDAANKDFIESLGGSAPQDLLDREIATPGDLDELWSAFFASGNREYVERICSVFSWDVSSLNRTSPRWQVNGAAAWSIGSNASRHPIVLEVCKANEENADAFAKPIYQKILKDVETKRKGEPTR
jgi:hypothetical protein